MTGGEQYKKKTDILEDVAAIDLYFLESLCLSQESQIWATNLSLQKKKLF